MHNTTLSKPRDHLSLKVFALACLVAGFYLGKAVGRDEIRVLDPQPSACSHTKG